MITSRANGRVKAARALGEAKERKRTGLFADDNPTGLSFVSAAIILAIMILPIISSLTREVMTAVPHSQREAVLALGATRWEMIRMGVLRNARIGIVGAVILGLGRALGETMAVLMVIGNRPQVAASLFSPGYTLASVVASLILPSPRLMTKGLKAGAVKTLLKSPDATDPSSLDHIELPAFGVFIGRVE